MDTGYVYHVCMASCSPLVSPLRRGSSNFAWFANLVKFGFPRLTGENATSNAGRQTAATVSTTRARSAGAGQRRRARTSFQVDQARKGTAMAGGSQAQGPVEMVVKTMPVRVVTSES